MAFYTGAAVLMTSITARATYSAQLLSNGRYTVLLGPAGGGCSLVNGIALTRWTPDPTCDHDGTILFIRDLDSGEYWTAAASAADGCTHGNVESAVRYGRDIHGIESDLCIGVHAELDAELRRLTLRNASAGPRRLEVTTCLEIALNSLAGDAAHPAFSRLFVQTEYVERYSALLAERRRRSPDDQPVVAVHALIGAGQPEFETDRSRFIGRGRDRSAPAALSRSQPLGATVGSVLDPLFSLSRVVQLQPGDSVTLTAVLGGAASRDGAFRILEVLATAADIELAFAVGLAPAQGVANDADPQALIPAEWRPSVNLATAGPAAFRPPYAAAAGTPVFDDIHVPAVAPAQVISPAASAAAPPTLPVAPTLEAARPDIRVAMTDAGSLRLFNGWGGFNSDGSEYVILLPREGPGRPPQPWVNVIANAEAGCIVSESGATHTWSGNSRENRITPWFNDPVTDRHGEALFIRDDDDGSFWSPTPGPRPGVGDYEVRHGFGYSTFLHESRDLSHEVVVFVPTDAPCRIARVRLTNNGRELRHLSVWSYAQLVLGSHEAVTRGALLTVFDPETRAILASQPERGEFSGRLAFAAAVCDADAELSWSTDRREFLGHGGCITSPAAVQSGSLAHVSGTGHDPCAAMALTLTLRPGETATCAFILGEAMDEGAARTALGQLSSVAAVNRELHSARTTWAYRVSAVTVDTPSPAIDLMVNGWLTYQNLSCRMWARTAFYQSGGAFGFRDQLQDSSALLYLDPALTRRQILLHAAHQFVEGDVLHWWHPPLSKGIRTRFSDDLLWLPYITAFYIRSTGDAGILDEQVRYLTAPLLRAGEDEEFMVPEDSGSSGTLHEHCCRALDRSLTSGTNGLPLMGVGDWNDGMNRVGREGRGESVWLGFFLYDILCDFTGICISRGEHNRARRYRDYRSQLGDALNDSGWDGEWYRRAFYDNGEPIGSAASDECRIDALAQAWAVLSGAASTDRATLALDAMEAQLVNEDDGIIRLLAPPFDATHNDPGYIKGYLPGVRENGGQYTHGVLWAVRALAEHGRCERAAPLLAMLSPVTHGASQQRAARYQAEPYVVAADIYGVAPHVGRGGWTWYTGSAGWMYRTALESVLGLELAGGETIRLRPCIPSAWPGFKVRYRLPDGTVYRINVERTHGTSSMVLDDGPAAPAREGALHIPLLRDGSEHHVLVRLGTDVGQCYVPR
jgi:N,N'-diacetylchitobiose phosphorylase